MGTVNLERALRPTGVAVISVGRGRCARQALDNLVAHEFTGQVYCVGIAPPAPSVQTAHKVENLPPEGTLLILDAPSEQIPHLVQQAGELGFPGVLIMSREAPMGVLRAFCQEHPQTRVIGPGSRGLIIPALGLNASLHRGLPGHGGLAMISSSPLLWDQLLYNAQRKRLGLSHLVSLGEQVDVDAADVTDYLHRRGRVRCLVLDSSSVPKPDKLLPAVWSFARDRPLIAHSSQSPWDWQVFSCALERAGAIPLEDKQELLSLLEITCRLDHPPPGPQVVLLSSTGEEALPEGHSRRVLHLSPHTRHALGDLGCSVSRTHVSLPSGAGEQDWLHTVHLLLDDARVHMLLSHSPPPLSPAAAAQAAAAAEKACKPLAIAATDAQTVQVLSQAGIATYASISEPLRLLDRLARHAHNLRKLHRWWGNLPAGPRPQQRPKLPPGQTPQDLLIDTLARWGIKAKSTTQPAQQRSYSVGLRRHPLFGTVVTCSTDIPDSFLPAVGMPPLTRPLARSMVAALSRPLPAAEERALTELLIRTSQLAGDLPQLVELELSPVVIIDREPIALDARARFEADCPEPHVCLCPYPLERTCTVKLKDGTALSLRPIRPDDAPRWRRMLTTSSSESLRLRYHSVHHAPSRRMARRHCCIDYHREFVIVAEARTENRAVLAGEGELFLDSDCDLSEFAVFVADPWQGKGLGSILTDYMVELARQLGACRVTCELTPDNVRMINLLQRRGFAVRIEMEDRVVFAEKELSQPPPPAGA